jgi:multiple sugar transport system substrate-binding protein
MTVLVAGAAVTALGLTACSGGSGSGTAAGGATSGDSAKKVTSIKLVAAEYSKDHTAAFWKQFAEKYKARTGTTLDVQIVSWDAIDQQSSTMIQNNNAPDILNLNAYASYAKDQLLYSADDVLSPAVKSDLLDAFVKSGTYQGKMYGMPDLSSARALFYNKAMFAKAGITQFPATFDELSTDVQKLKNSGVQYPLAVPMAATEGGVTPWYLLTLAMGGQLFDDHNNPVFSDPNSAGYKALQWEVDAVKNGWVSPGSVELNDDIALNKFTGGQNAILLATGPGNMPPANDPSQSNIAGHAQIALVPGMTGAGGSFGLPEGLSIPVTAKHKAAAAAFIEWWEQPKNAIAIYNTQGSLPCGASTLKQLSDSGQLQGGDVVTAELPHVGPLFPGGAPIWYSQFSADAQGLLNAAVKGDMSVSDALNQLSEKTAARNQ